MVEQDGGSAVPGRQEQILVDEMLINGIDALAVWRNHLRELTMARQAAERRAERWLRTTTDGLLLDSGEPSTALHMELARLQAGHRAWLQEHGVQQIERRTRTPRPARTA